MRTAKEIEISIDELKRKKEKLETALENMRFRIVKECALWNKATHREEPATYVKHIDSFYDKDHKHWEISFIHEGEKYTVYHLKKPTVKNGSLSPSGKLITGGKTWIKDRTIEAYKKENILRKAFNERQDKENII